MKNKKEKTAFVIGLASLALAVVATFAPLKSQGNMQEPNKQKTETLCVENATGRTFDCNNCDSGTSTCTDKTCAQCDA